MAHAETLPANQPRGSPFPKRERATNADASAGARVHVPLATYVFVMVAFFRRKANTPKYIISLYVLNIVFVLLDRFVFQSLPQHEWQYGITMGTVSALIWIPYFLVSKRVKGTFTVP